MRSLNAMVRAGIDGFTTSCDLRSQAMARVLRSQNSIIVFLGTVFLLMCLLYVALGGELSQFLVSAAVPALMVAVPTTLAAVLFSIISMQKWFAKLEGAFVSRSMKAYKFACSPRGFAALLALSLAFLSLGYLFTVGVRFDNSDLKVGLITVIAFLTVASMLLPLLVVVKYVDDRVGVLTKFVRFVLTRTILRKIRVTFAVNGQTQVEEVTLLKAFFLVIGVCKAYFPK